VTELEWILRLKADLYCYVLIIVLRLEACNHFYIWLYFRCSPAASLKQATAAWSQIRIVIDAMWNCKAEWWLLTDKVIALLL